MSRGQQKQVYDQTKGESQQSFGDAQNSYNLAQGDIADYKTQLGRFAAENPYRAGGEFQLAQNKVLANTADASAQSAGARLQSQAARTGQNPAGSIAATEAMQQSNERDLAAQQAMANEERIRGGANYNKQALDATALPVGMETSIARGQGDLYGTALGVQEQAAKTPSFLETLEGQLAQGGDAFLGGLGQGYGKNL